jgi:hypothetical protein
MWMKWSLTGFETSLLLQDDSFVHLCRGKWNASKTLALNSSNCSVEHFCAIQSHSYRKSLQFFRCEK